MEPTAPIEDVLLGPQATVLEALEVIDRGAREVALIVDAQRTLLGLVTDGDIRRALVTHQDLHQPVLACATTAPLVARATDSRADALDLMRAHHVSQLPIVDDVGRLVGLHTLADFVMPHPLPHRAVVLCGGKGTRLGTLTQSVPKPMVPVGGRPILEWVLLHLMGGGISRFSFAVNYLAEQIVDHFGDGSRFGVSIDYLHEEPGHPLGTAGPLAALPLEPDPVLVMNGDIMARFDVASLLSHHDEHGGPVTVVTREHEYRVPFGVVRLDDGGRVLEIQEKPTQSWPILAGIYVLAPGVISLLEVGVPRDMPGLLEEVQGRGTPLRSWVMQDEWLDVGSPDDLARARGWKSQ